MYLYSNYELIPARRRPGFVFLGFPFSQTFSKNVSGLSLSNIGYTPITRNQANRFFTFISDTYETFSIIFTTNKEIMGWAKMMGSLVLTTTMLDRILHHANCYSFRG